MNMVLRELMNNLKLGYLRKLGNLEKFSEVLATDGV